jgi:flagellar biogenesis protein FliO
MVEISATESSPLGPLEEGSGFGWRLLETALLLLLVCVLAYLVIRFGLRRLQGQGWRARTGRRRREARLEVLHRVAIEPKRSLQVVQAGSRVLLLGVTERAIHLLAELEPGEWLPIEPEEGGQTDGDFASRLRAGLGDKRSAGSGEASDRRGDPTAPPSPPAQQTTGADRSSGRGSSEADAT